MSFQVNLTEEQQIEIIPTLAGFDIKTKELGDGLSIVVTSTHILSINQDSDEPDKAIPIDPTDALLMSKVGDIEIVLCWDHDKKPDKGNKGHFIITRHEDALAIKVIHWLVKGKLWSLSETCSVKVPVIKPGIAYSQTNTSVL